MPGAGSRGLCARAAAFWRLFTRFGTLGALVLAFWGVSVFLELGTRAGDGAKIRGVTVIGRPCDLKERAFFGVKGTSM